MKSMGAKGLARAKIDASGNWVQSPLAKMVSDDLRRDINAAVGAEDGDYVFFQFGREAAVHTVMADLRIHLAKSSASSPRAGTAESGSSSGS